MKILRTPPTATPSRSRRVGRASLAVGALAGLALVSGCSGATSVKAGATPSSSATPTASPTSTSPSASATPTPTPTAVSPSTYAAPGGAKPTVAPSVGVTTLPPVPSGQGASFSNGLVVTATRTSDVTTQPNGPGEIKGPGVAVVLSLVNRTGVPLDLSGVTVTAALKDGTPADPSAGPPAAAPAGVLAVGATATGTWVFRVPAAGERHLVLTVTSTSSADAVVVTL